MSDLYRNYTDPNGDLYSNFTTDGKVTPYGYHFKNPVATAQFIAYVVWLACFTCLTVGICWVRNRDKSKPTRERASYKYLRWPVMGVSTICMVLIYTMQVYNRIVHEITKSIPWYYPAVIGVGVSVLSGFAQGLLIAFLLWQLTPILLQYGEASPKRTKWTILFCRFLAWLINIVNTADTLVTAILWVLQVRKAYFDIKTDRTEAKVTKISDINDAALTATFTGMFLLCVLIFAAVTRLALKNLHMRFKVILSLLTAAMILRSLLDFLWALIFKVGALHEKLKFSETLATNLIHTVLYGFFSTVVYACVLGIATLPVPDHGGVALEYLPEKARRWHQRLSFRGAEKHPVPVAQELGKGVSNGATVEEVTPIHNGYWYNDGAQGERTNAEGSDKKRFRDGIEYQPPRMQGHY